MTNILLSIIAILLLARVVLQVKQGKRAVEKGYAAPSEVENTFRHVQGNTFAIRSTLDTMSQNRWELVNACAGEDDSLLLFFTKKKNQDYYPEEFKERKL